MNPLQKAKNTKKKTILIVCDNMVSEIEESKLSKTSHIRAQPLSGAKIKDLEANLVYFYYTWE